VEGREPLSEDPELTSQHCSESVGHPSEAIFAVFGGNPFVDILCGPTCWSTTIEARCDVE
jgi:hypothetical protein